MATVQLAPVHTRLLQAWTTIAHSAVAIPLTGTTAQTDLVTFNLAAGALGPNGILKIDMLIGFSGTAGNKTVYVSFGGAGNVFAGVMTATWLSSRLQVLIANRNNQASQIISANNTAIFTGSTVALNTATVDTSAVVAIAIRGALINAADTLRLEAYSAEVLYGT